jgi:hypothetical protein
LLVEKLTCSSAGWVGGFQQLGSWHFGFCEADKIVTYLDSRGKGHKEDFDFEELEAAIELYNQHDGEDK